MIDGRLFLPVQDTAGEDGALGLLNRQADQGQRAAAGGPAGDPAAQPAEHPAGHQQGDHQRDQHPQTVHGPQVHRAGTAGVQGAERDTAHSPVGGPELPDSLSVVRHGVPGHSGVEAGVDPQPVGPQWGGGHFQGDQQPAGGRVDPAGLLGGAAEGHVAV